MSDTDLDVTMLDGRVAIVLLTIAALLTLLELWLRRRERKRR